MDSYAAVRGEDWPTDGTSWSDRSSANAPRAAAAVRRLGVHRE